MAEYQVSTVIDAKTARFKQRIKESISLLKRYENYIKSIKDVELKADSLDLDKTVELVKNKLKQIDNKKVKAHLLANTNDADIKLKRINHSLRMVDSKKAVAKVEVNTQNAVQKMMQHKKALDYLNNKTIMTSIDLNNKSFKSQYMITKKQLNELDRKAVKSAIKVDDTLAKAEIKTVKAKLRSVPNVIHTRLKVNSHGLNFLSAINRQSDVFQERMDRIAKSIRTFGTILGNVIKGSAISAFSALIPIAASLVPVVMAIGNALAVVGGGAIGLAGAFSIAGAGAIAFGGMAATAISMFNDGLIRSTDATDAYEKSLKGLTDTWQEIVKINADSIFGAMASAMYGAQSALKNLTPFLSTVADLVDLNAHKFEEWVSTSETAQNAFKALNTTGVQIFADLLNAGGHFGDGLINIFTQFMPLFKFMSQGLQNMGIAFEEWANKVSTQQGINNFIEYVKTNLPIIGKIFGDTFLGLFNLFKAFGSNSQTIFEALSEMTGKFKAWSETVGKSEGFKRFIDYVQQNGPQIVSLIGNIIMVLVNFGTAMAPIGSAVLSVVNSVAQFIAKLFETNPAVAQLLGVLISFGGLLMALIPQIVGFASFFGPLITKFMTLSMRFGLLKAVALLFSRALTVLGTAFTTTIGPILAIIAVIGALVALFVYLWNTNETFRTKVIEIWNAVSELIMSAVNSIVNFVMEIWGMLVQWWNENNQLILQTIQTIWDLIGPYIMNAINTIVTIVQAGWQILIAVVQFAWDFITTIVKTAISLVLNIITLVMQLITGNWSGAWETIKTIGSTIWSAIVSIGSSLFNSLRSILTSIWNAIVSIATSTWNMLKQTIWDRIVQAYNIVSSTAQQIWSTISSKFSEIVSTVTSKMSEFYNTIKQKVQDALNAVMNFAGEFASAGRDLIMGLVNGVKDAAGNLISAVGDAVGGAIDHAKSLLGIKSPSRVFKGIGIYTMQGLSNGITEEGSSVISDVVRIAKSMTQNFNPNLTADHIGIQSSLGNLSSTIVQRVQHTHDIQARPQQRLVRVEMDVNNDALTTLVNGEMAHRNTIIEF
jgi:phage-related protein